MKIAYLVNQYPKVSHSFIRREILALESQGYEVERFALRSDESELVDEDDRSEHQKTRYILSLSVLEIFACFFRQFWLDPFRTFEALGLAVKIGWRSDRGLLRHFVYFAEACVLSSWVREREVGHVHAHFGTNPAAIAMLSKVMGGASYSFTVHGPEEFDKPEFISLGEKIRRSKFTVAITSYCQSQLYRQVSSEHWEKIKIVHCGLDEKFLGPIDTDTEGDEKTLVCVGRLCEQKGQLLLVDAVKALADQGVDVKLILAGDGPMRLEVEQKIAEHRVEEFVSITGWIDADTVKELLVSSRALVLPSFAEGLPVVIMEALAMERPVISTYVAGIPELVVNEENGWLVSAGSVDELVVAMREALAVSGTVVKQYGENGRQMVLARHNVSEEVKKLLSFVES